MILVAPQNKLMTRRTARTVSCTCSSDLSSLAGKPGALEALWAKKSVPARLEDVTFGGIASHRATPSRMFASLSSLSFYALAPASLAGTDPCDPRGMNGKQEGSP